MDELKVRVATLPNEPVPSAASLAKNYQIAPFTPSRILKLFVESARRDSVTSQKQTLSLWSESVLIHATLYFIGDRSKCSEGIRQVENIYKFTCGNVVRQHNPSKIIISWLVFYFLHEKCVNPSTAAHFFMTRTCCFASTRAYMLRCADENKIFLLKRELCKCENAKPSL